MKRLHIESWGCLDRKEVMCVYCLDLSTAVLAQGPRISSLSRLHCVGNMGAASEVEQLGLFPLGIVWFYDRVLNSNPEGKGR